ncbi:ribokinase-like [Phymastichus coffea]|uniref:ribokinase-like n=1 Tax=Phymastichus coffea TaxID=108790 RepID=UPI00273BDBCA|nr:ribokinase-like [Phymastichus coffea]XP_058790011.1 ribokinase-like [Phymastichus coffea]
MSKTIAVVGSCMIDSITYSSRLPKPGETIIGNKYEQGFGGKGANQCVTAARLGASTIFIASLGSDSSGKEYIKKLKTENIDTSYIKVHNDLHTGFAQIMVTETGENVIVIVQGSNTLLSSKDVEEAKEAIQNASVLLCQFEIPLEINLTALKLYKGHGTSIVNAAPAIKDINTEIFKLSDIFCVNESEAEIMTGIENITVANAQLAVDKFFILGCNTVIITLGSQGAVYASKSNKNIIHIPSEPVKAVDTTGAGDAFLGALAYFIAYHSDLSLEECIKRSNRIAAESVMKTGTQTSFPYKKDLPKELF